MTNEKKACNIKLIHWLKSSIKSELIQKFFKKAEKWWNYEDLKIAPITLRARASESKQRAVVHSNCKRFCRLKARSKAWDELSKLIDSEFYHKGWMVGDGDAVSWPAFVWPVFHWAEEGKQALVDVSDPPPKVSEKGNYSVFLKHQSLFTRVKRVVF